MKTEQNDINNMSKRSRQKNNLNNAKVSRSEPRKNNFPRGEYLTFGRMLSFIAFIVMIGVLTLGFYLYTIADSKMDKRKLDHLVSEVVDKDGKVVGVLGGLNYEAKTPEKINDNIKDSFIATEDSRFFTHPGVDVTRLASAVAAKGQNGGASTLTQQLVKNLYLSPEKTITRKINEAVMSLSLERQVSKEKLLSSYLNIVNLGGNTIGIQTAAKTYFSKDQENLTLPEASVLGGLPQLPNAYNPHVSIKKAIGRRKTVLALMNRHGYIDDWEYNATYKMPLKVRKETTVLEDKNHKLQSFFDIVDAELKIKYHYQNINKGMQVRTNMDTKLQEKMYDLKNVKANGKSIPSLPYDFGSAVVNVKDGTLAGAYGGRKFRYGLFNNAFNLKAQPGSSIKPIVVYGAGVEYKGWDTETKFKDAYEKYSHGAVIKNYENRYYGKQPLWLVLAGSLNVPAIVGLRDVGYEKAQEFAKNLGLIFDEGTFYESYALGAFIGVDELVSPMKMAGAYTAFANNGYWNEPHAITSIKLDTGKIKNAEYEKHQAMKPSTAYILTQAMHKTMSNSIHGLPSLLATLGDTDSPYFTFGKSGTTTYADGDYKKYHFKEDRAKDQWADVCSSTRCTSVWTGHDKVYKKHTLGEETYQYRKAILDKILKDMKTGNEKDMNKNPPKGITKEGKRKDGSGAKKYIHGKGGLSEKEKDHQKRLKKGV